MIIAGLAMPASAQTVADPKLADLVNGTQRTDGFIKRRLNGRFTCNIRDNLHRARHFD